MTRIFSRWEWLIGIPCLALGMWIGFFLFPVRWPLVRGAVLGAISGIVWGEIVGYLRRVRGHRC